MRLARTRRQRSVTVAPSSPTQITGNDHGLSLAPMTCARRLRQVFEIGIHQLRMRLPVLMDHRGSPADVTQPAVIHTNLLHVQSRAPPLGGLPNGDLHDADAWFTLAHVSVNRRVRQP